MDLFSSTSTPPDENRSCNSTRCSSCQDSESFPVLVLYPLGSVIIIFNVIVFSVLCRRKIFPDNIKQMYLLNVSIADSLQGVVLIMRAAILSLHPYLHEMPNPTGHVVAYLCVARVGLTVVAVATSMSLLASCTAHVYIRCAHPMSPLSRLSTRTHRLIITTIWLLVFAYGITCIPLMNVEEFMLHHDCVTQHLLPTILHLTFIGVFFAVPSILIVPLQVHLCVVVSRTLRRTVSTSFPRDDDDYWAEVRRKEIQHERSQMRHAVTVTIISSSFVICWLPYFIFVILPNNIGAGAIVLAEWAGVGCYLPALLNPFIYTWRVATFRDMIFTFLQKPVHSFNLRESWKKQNGSVNPGWNPDVIPRAHPARF